MEGEEDTTDAEAMEDEENENFQKELEDESEEEEIEEDDEEDNSSSDNPKIKKNPNKVYINIEDRSDNGELHTFTCTDERLGKPYTSVGFSAGNYGSGCPCENEEEINKHIKYSREWIIQEGDIPIVMDKRDRCKLSRWCI